MNSSGKRRKWQWYSSAVVTKNSTWWRSSSQPETGRIRYWAAQTRTRRTGCRIGDAAMRRRVALKSGLGRTRKVA